MDFPPINIVNVLSLPSDIFFSSFIVRMKYIVHINKKICVNHVYVIGKASCQQQALS